MVLPEEDDERDAEDWAELFLGDLEADLKASEQTIASIGELETTKTSEDSLRKVLQTGSAGASLASFDADIFFSAHRALHGIAVELQEVLIQVETQQFNAASLVASLVHGPLRPPVRPSTDLWIGLPAEKVFGPNAAPTAPPPLELIEPATAEDLPDYERRLSALPNALFVTRKLSLCVGDVDRHQDQKDIGRDELVMNGKPLHGAKGGYEGALAVVSSALQAEGTAANDANYEGQLLLSVLNRTCSGFAAFEEVFRLFNCQDVVVLSPESAAARPLEAVIIGGVALGRAHTRYAVRRADGSHDEPLTVIDAVFCFRITTSTLRRLAHPSNGAGSRKGWPSEDICATVLIHHT